MSASISETFLAAPYRHSQNSYLRNGFAAPLFLESPYALIDSQPQVDGAFPVFARQVDHFEEKKVGGMGHIVFFRMRTEDVGGEILRPKVDDGEGTESSRPYRGR